MGEPELSNETVVRLAMACGFSVHHSWGKWSDALPMADSETLANFAQCILAEQKEMKEKTPPVDSN